MNKLKRKKKAVILSLILVVAVFVVTTIAWQRLNSSAGTPPFPTEIARRGDIRQVVIATGKIEVTQRVEVRAQISALVQRMLVDIGDQVRAGQVLAIMDASELQAQVQQAEARVMAARSAVRRDIIGAAEARLRLVTADYQRQVSLFEHGLIARQALDHAQYDKEQAEIERANARAEQARLDANLREAEAALALARERLSKATVISPIDGIVLARQVEPGLFTSAELNPTPLFTLGANSSFRFQGEVAESEIGFLSPGVPVNVKVEEIPDRIFRGHLETIYPAAVERENFSRIKIRVKLDEGRYRFRDQTTAKAEIPVRQRTNVVLINEKVIQYDGQQPFVEVLDNTAPSGKRRIDIQVGVRNGIEVEVLSGLAAGDQVVYIQP